MVTEVLTRFGIEHTFVDMTDTNEVARNIKPNTKVIYMETPSNPTLGITDIKAVVQLAKENGCLTFLDNTFMTPALRRPLDLGVDIVLHSATKFLSGHSDVLSGLVAVKDEELGKRLYKPQNSFGAVLGVQDCWLVFARIKNIAGPFRKSEPNSARLAEFFQKHPAVKRVYYPGLSDHPGAETHKSQSTGAGAVLSLSLKAKRPLRN